ncbi:hypothetical protein [Emticicia fontis]
METKTSLTKIRSLQILTFLFFLGMVFVNFLANFLPINGKNTGEVSAQYPNLFVPTGLTFSIWGVIYLLLFIFCIYQMTSLFKSGVDLFVSRVIGKINTAFILTCIINMTWIVAWHYDLLIVSVILMLLLLNRLIYIDSQIRLLEPYMSNAQSFIVKAPFGLYLGWICIATIANITALLVSYGWRGFGMSEESWTSMMVLIGSLIGVVAILRFNNFYIGLAVIWALSGIIIERKSDTVYYEYVVLSAWAGIIIVAISVFIELFRGTFRKRHPLIHDHI